MTSVVYSVAKVVPITPFLLGIQVLIKGLQLPRWGTPSGRESPAFTTNELGSLHYFGQHFPRNYERALELFRKSATLGNPDAICNLAVCHMHGHGVPQDYQEALRLYTLASERGDVDALKDIGRVRAILRDDPTQALSKPKAKKPKPNQPCSCGSGKKYKKCCGAL